MGYERRSVSTLSIPRVSDRGVEGLIVYQKAYKLVLGLISSLAKTKK
jgi:hypothetical protein